MIRAIMFDLDGTLVQSEKLKAQSYAIAAQRILGLPEPDSRAIEAYREIVGAARDVASRHIMDRLRLESDLHPLMTEYAASEPWGVLSAMRKEIYDDMVADPQVIRDNQWPHTVGLLRVARETYCRTGLATLSARTEALHFVRSLDPEGSLDVVLAREVSGWGPGSPRRRKMTLATLKGAKRPSPKTFTKKPSPWRMTTLVSCRYRRRWDGLR